MEKELDKVVVWEPIDIGDDPIRAVSLEGIPPGPERDEAERLLAELRERQERETGADQKPGSEGSEASAATEAEGSRATKESQGKRFHWRPVNPDDRRAEVVALGPKAAAAYGRQAQRSLGSVKTPRSNP